MSLKEENECIRDLITIFWPNDLTISNDKKKYIILGYKINKFKYVGVDFMRYNDYKDINHKIDKDIFRNLEVISCINFKSKKINNIIIDYDFNRNRPILGQNQNLIYFKPPKSWRLEYYSLDPIAINIFWTKNDQNVEQIFKKPSTNKYAEKLKLHFIDLPARLNNSEMKEVLRIINLTNYIRSKLDSINNKNLFRNLLNEFYSKFDTFAILMSFFYYFFVQQPCYFFSSLLTYSFFDLKYKFANNKNSQTTRHCTKFSLHLLSYTFHQINLRLNQFYSLPLQFKKLKLSKIESEAAIIKYSNFSPSEYIKFYNTVWLIINDLLLGGIFSNFLINNHNQIISNIPYLISIYETSLGKIIIWLMNSPAGFKLNNELASFMGQLILWVLELWKNTMLKWFVVNIDVLLKIVETITRFGGLSIFISILMDLNILIFLNIYGFYIASTRLYYWQINILRSLFKLFYGKKYNILRNRVDSNDYEFDQLMLGIIIFTILLYLLPTVFIFYLTFVTARLGILIISFILKFIIISLNHLPVVVFLLKLKNQERLPSGIILKLDHANNYFILESRSLSLEEIFKSHINSMLNFNLFNLNIANSGGFYDNEQDLKYQINHVVENWNRISLITLTKNILFGEKILDYDYKKMF
jgi:phosphatidylinositol glycan class Q protein